MNDLELDDLAKTLSAIHDRMASLTANGVTSAVLAHGARWLRTQADDDADADPALYRTVADIAELEIQAQKRLHLET